MDKPTPIGLDLGQSRAKLARAYELVESLEGHILAHQGQSPHDFSFGDIDEDGWCSVRLVPNETDEHVLGVLFGDVVHNLRSALDYLISQVVIETNVAPFHKHQFPIYDTADAYSRCVGTVTTAKNNGPLKGITDPFVLYLVEQDQPYHAQPDPHTSLLYQIHRFSNADKHREIATFQHSSSSERMRFEVFPDSIEIVDTELFPLGAVWSPYEEREIARVRLSAEPIYLKARIEVASKMWFYASPYGHKCGDLRVSPDTPRAMCNAVAKVVECFEIV